MKNLTKNWRAALLLVSVVFLSVGMVASLSALPNDDANSLVIRPTTKLTYAVYQELAENWWNWALQFPAATNPVLDETGEFGHLGQKGPVWFLAGTFGGSVTREVTVPEGKFIFFPIANSVFWAPEDGETEAEVRAGANASADTISVVTCTINGKKVKNLLQKHRVETDAFTLHLPEGGLLDDIGAFPPGDRYPAVTDGYWVLLKPLPKGKHVIHFYGAFGDPEAPDFFSEATYHLTVVGDDD